MKKYTFILMAAIAIAIAITACGPSAKQLEEKRIADSIKVADSLACVQADQQKVADSLAIVAKNDSIAKAAKTVKK